MKEAAQAKLLIYTRLPNDDYTEALSYSIHLAFSEENQEFIPFNQNYGILFAPATINEKDVIEGKGLKNPYLFRTREGEFAIIATRVEQLGDRDAESKGSILLWYSKDLIHFDYQGLLLLHPEHFIEQAICSYSTKENGYIIEWKDSEGNFYKSIRQSLCLNALHSDVKQGQIFSKEKIVTGLQDIVIGNTIVISNEELSLLKEKWLPIEHIANEVPENVCVSSPDEVEKIQVELVYSDGSKVRRSVKWQMGQIDFTQNGVYEIEGEINETIYPFPLAKGYADPVILPWKGEYYYLATNDNTDDIGIYVRKGHEISELFDEGYKEYKILDVDKEKAFIQTFWAPEFHLIGGRLYILFAVGPEKWGPQCHMMRLRENGDITKAEDWETPVRVKKRDGSYLTEEGITLDMTYFKVKDISYVVWSYRRNIGTPLDTGSMLYIATVDEEKPNELTSEPVLLTRPLLGWENIQGTINNEGPYALITEDKVYLTYSGGAAGGYTYAIGMLSISVDGDLLSPKQWEKASTPVLSYYSMDHLYGPGHNSFFRDEQGMTMIMYHGEVKLAKEDVRCTGMHRVHFNQKGEPIMNLSPERDLNPKLNKVKISVRTQKS